MSKPDLHQEILSLTKEWYSLIVGDHHKNRDCIWSIETVWSYGEVPTYRVIHNAYIGEDVDISCSSYEEALEELAVALKDAIKLEKQNESIDSM